MGKFYTYIERFCDKQGKAYGWEFILDHFIKDEAVKIHYIKCGSSWMNINFQQDYELAKSKIFPIVEKEIPKEVEKKVDKINNENLKNSPKDKNKETSKPLN